MRAIRYILAYACLILALFVFHATADAREVVRFEGYRPGTIVVKTGERRLYYVERAGLAVAYPVAVGRAGKAWSGETRIVRKAVDPVWGVPRVVRASNPALPQTVPPGPANPLGPRALVLAAGEYAIHGTNDPSSIGRAVSWGCIRMRNADVVELFDRVRVGTPVIVMR